MVPRRAETAAAPPRVLQDGATWRADASGGRRRFELVPRRRNAIPRLALAVVWIGLIGAMILSVTRGRGFLFLPIVLFLSIVLVPFKRYYIALCAAFNRLTFTIDTDRFEMRQGPLPCGHALACATDDIATVRRADLDQYVGWLADGDTRWSSVAVALRDGTRTVFPLRVADARTADFMANALTDALQSLRAPRTYRA